MAGIEFTVLAWACLKGRSFHEQALQGSISAYGAARNATAATVNWRFTARAKLRRLYLDTSTFTQYWPPSEVHRKLGSTQGSPPSPGG